MIKKYAILICVAMIIGFAVVFNLNNAIITSHGVAISPWVWWTSYTVYGFPEGKRYYYYDEAYRRWVRKTEPYGLIYKVFDAQPGSIQGVTQCFAFLISCLIITNWLGEKIIKNR